MASRVGLGLLTTILLTCLPFTDAVFDSDCREWCGRSCRGLTSSWDRDHCNRAHRECRRSQCGYGGHGSGSGVHMSGGGVHFSSGGGGGGGGGSENNTIVYAFVGVIIIVIIIACISACVRRSLMHRRAQNPVVYNNAPTVIETYPAAYPATTINPTPAYGGGYQNNGYDYSVPQTQPSNMAVV